MGRIAQCWGLAAVLGLVIGLSGRAEAGTIVSWDWNDGTTQGWQGSSGATNSNGRLLAFNNGNGSLQMFGPFLSAAARDWSNLSEIRFDVEIASYSGISSPSEFTHAEVEVHWGGGQMFGITWDLDVTGWMFGQTRTFIVQVSQPAVVFGPLTKEQILENVENINLFFTSNSDANTSSAYVDNFIVSGATVPEPPALTLGGTSALIGLGYWWRRRRHAVA
jgi:hypothetical protein